MSERHGEDFQNTSMKAWPGKPALPWTQKGVVRTHRSGCAGRCLSDAIVEQAQCIPLRRYLPIRVGHDQPRGWGKLGLFRKQWPKHTVR